MYKEKAAFCSKILEINPVFLCEDLLKIKTNRFSVASINMRGVFILTEIL
jgi:hypothetical protein